MKIPHNLTTELTVLSTGLTTQENLYKLLECDERIFLDDRCKKIFSVIKELAEEYTKVELRNVESRINIDGKYNNIIAQMIELYTINIDAEIQELETLWLKREVLKNADKIKSLAGKDLDAAFALYDQIEEIKDKQKINNICTIAEIAELPLDKIYSKDAYLKTGIDCLDEMIIGIFKTQLVVVAGQPGSGKTTLMLNILCNVNDGLLISGEMKREEIYTKILSRCSKVDSRKIESCTFNEDEAKRILKSRGWIKDNTRLTLEDSSLLYPYSLNVMKKICRQNKIKLIGYDYSQLTDGLPGGNRNEELSYLSRKLKNFAKKEGVPVIVGSQLSKTGYNKEPTLSDLRDTGAIADNADLVIFTWEDQDKVNYVTIGKGRKVKIGRVKNIKFNKEYSEFIDITGNSFYYS